MYTPYKLTPGPAGTSCLTCRRRHKKCDQRKPTCERCSIGGYECSGYGCKTNRGVSTRPEPQRVRRPVRDPSPPNSPSGESMLSSALQSTEYQSKAGESGASLEAIFSNRQPRSLNTLASHGGRDKDIVYDISPPKSRRQSPGTVQAPSPATHSNTTMSTLVLSTLPTWLSSSGQIPRNVFMTLSDIRHMMEYVVSQFERGFQTLYFRPRPDTIAEIREDSMMRMKACSLTRKVMFVDAKVFASIWDGSISQLQGQFTGWVENCENELRERMRRSLTPSEFQTRLGDTLEIYFLKSMLLSSSNTYRLLRHATPTFLQIVFSDSTLWPTQRHNPALVSIAHLLASPRYEPAQFVLMDALCAMVHGAPQLVEYNTEIQPFHTDPHPVEWLQGCPGEFQILLARINACRDQSSFVDDWQEIEGRLISWQPRLKCQLSGLESWKSVAWLAVQESWRQTLLIYLYLAVCGVSSDDVRVQSSVRQIFQLKGAIRRQEPPEGNVNYVVQYLIAGVCTQSEKQRMLVRARLSCVSETQFWLLRGSDFVPVLDHLWLGAASGGRPVKWRDYVHSREAALPLCL